MSKSFVRKAIKIHGNRYDYSKVIYINSKIPILIIDTICGREFSQCPNDHLCGKGCPHCQKSKGEEIIEKILNENNIIFEKFKKFKWLIYKNSMNLDFYLPECNIAIEYQGEQHFKPYRFQGDKGKERGLKKLELVQNRDKTKFEQCKENGVKLLYVSFYKKLPQTYFDKIYTSEQELIDEINNIIKQKGE